MEKMFVNKLSTLVSTLMDNPYVFILISIATYLLGGVDETLIVLFSLNVIDFTLSLLSSEKNVKKVFSYKIKMYLVIILGVMLDKILGTEHNQVTKARTYIILAYSYNEIVNIVNCLCSDEGFFVPPGLRRYVEKIKHKSGDKK